MEINSKKHDMDDESMFISKFNCKFDVETKFTVIIFTLFFLPTATFGSSWYA